MTFEVGVFTNFSEDHIGGVEHKDMERVFAVQRKCYSNNAVLGLSIAMMRYGKE